MLKQWMSGNYWSLVLTRKILLSYTWTSATQAWNPNHPGINKIINWIQIFGISYLVWDLLSVHVCPIDICVLYIYPFVVECENKASGRCDRCKWKRLEHFGRSPALGALRSQATPILRTKISFQSSFWYTCIRWIGSQSIHWI